MNQKSLIAHKFHPLVKQGMYDKAKPLYERSQAIRENVLGPGHPDVAQSLNNRADLLEKQVAIFYNISLGWSKIATTIFTGLVEKKHVFLASRFTM